MKPSDWGKLWNDLKSLNLFGLFKGDKYFKKIWESWLIFVVVQLFLLVIYNYLFVNGWSWFYKLAFSSINVSFFGVFILMPIAQYIDRDNWYDLDKKPAFSLFTLYITVASLFAFSLLISLAQMSEIMDLGILNYWNSGKFYAVAGGIITFSTMILDIKNNYTGNKRLLCNSLLSIGIFGPAILFAFTSNIPGLSFPDLMWFGKLLAIMLSTVVSNIVIGGFWFTTDFIMIYWKYR